LRDGRIVDEIRPKQRGSAIQTVEIK